MRFWSACAEVLAAAALAAAAQQAVPAPPADASALLAAFAKVEGLEARFEEEKHLALLAAPLSSRGRLYFMRPGYLVRQIEAPEPSKLTISPDELKMAGREGEERIDLRSSAEVRLFVTSILQVLLGDEAALKEHYDIAFDPGTGEAPAWVLTLVPRGPPLATLMKSLTLRGDGAHVRSIELLEPQGDRTLTRILDVDTARRFTEQERSELFEIRAR